MSHLNDRRGLLASVLACWIALVSGQVWAAPGAADLILKVLLTLFAGKELYRDPSFTFAADLAHTATPTQAAERM